MRQAAEGNTKFQLVELNGSTGEMSFVVPQIQVKYSARIVANGSLAAEIITQGGPHSPGRSTKEVSGDAKKPASALTEVWVGKLSVGGSRALRWASCRPIVS